MKTGDDDISIQILSIAKSGAPKKKMAEAVALPAPQFRRCMAALVDQGLLRYDPAARVWITTDKGHQLLTKR
jgi:predicted transcriptional regulator